MGHGARSPDELIALLKAEGIRLLVDVRAHPGSRRHPHFAAAPLRDALGTAGIEYCWEGRDLGGFRKPRADSPNLALPERGMRGYADHLLDPAGRAGIDRVAERAELEAVALMCAERDPAHCHRSLIADHLSARGFTVVHLLEPGRKRIHVLPDVARTSVGSVIYDAAGVQLPLLPES